MTIVANGVHRSFGSVVALDNVTVELDAPATGLLGANGAGKSTLMRCLLGLTTPDSGTLRVLGLEPGKDGHDIRRRIGYMPEHECLPGPMTAVDLCIHFAELRGLPHRAAVLRASEVLYQVGLDEERSRAIETFSTGMKQRAKLAQAIVHSPDLVLLDEPTNGLDPAGRVEMTTLVRRLSQDLGIGVLVSSHVLEDITATCDAVCVLRDGHVSLSGPLGNLDHDRSGRMRVRVVGDSGSFLAVLRGRSLQADLDEESGDVTVEGADAAILDAIRDGAVDAGVGIAAMYPGGRSVEDLLVRAMQ